MLRGDSPHWKSLAIRNLLRPKKFWRIVEFAETNGRMFDFYTKWYDIAAQERFASFLFEEKEYIRAGEISEGLFRSLAKNRITGRATGNLLMATRSFKAAFQTNRVERLFAEARERGLPVAREFSAFLFNRNLKGDREWASGLLLRAALEAPRQSPERSELWRDLIAIRESLGDAKAIYEAWDLVGSDADPWGYVKFLASSDNEMEKGTLFAEKKARETHSYGWFRESVTLYRAAGNWYRARNLWWEAHKESSKDLDKDDKGDLWLKIFETEHGKLQFRCDYAQFIKTVDPKVAGKVFSEVFERAFASDPSGRRLMLGDRAWREAVNAYMTADLPFEALHVLRAAMKLGRPGAIARFAEVRASCDSERRAEIELKLGETGDELIDKLLAIHDYAGAGKLEKASRVAESMGLELDSAMQLIQNTGELTSTLAESPQ